MDNHYITDQSAINAILQENNPFARPPYVQVDDIWNTDDFLDLESFNQKASDTVLQAVDDIHQGKYKSTSILMLASRSAGKSHLMRRLHYQIKVRHSGLFILISSLDVKQPVESFQALLANSLSRLGTVEISQWNELAVAILNRIREHQKQTPIEAKAYIQYFGGHYDQDPSKVIDVIEKAAKVYARITSFKNRDILRAILWTLVEDEEYNASRWLGGQELASYKANELRLPPQCQSLDTIVEILSVIGAHYEVIICFDELDQNDFDEHGQHRSEVAANLIKDLFQTLHRGVILTAMTVSTWTERVIKNTPPSVHAKMTAQGDPLQLSSSLDEAMSLELVRMYLARFNAQHQIEPPHDLYPFEEQDIREVSQERPLIRQFLEWCRSHCLDHIAPSGSKQPPAINPVEEIFQLEARAIKSSTLDDENLIGSALKYGFEGLIGLELETMLIQGVTDRVKHGSKSKTDSHINFRIDGTIQGQPYSIGVAVLQKSGKSLGNGLRKLLKKERSNFPMDRGCLVRSQDREISDHLYKTYVVPITEQEGGEFVNLLLEEIRPLIAVYEIRKKIGVDYTFTEQDLKQFIESYGEQYLLGCFNPLLREILSDPCSTAPNLALEPDASPSRSIRNSSPPLPLSQDVELAWPESSPAQPPVLEDDAFERIFGKSARQDFRNLF